MSTSEDSTFRLKRSVEALPTEGDFDPYGGCLDARTAWRHFGGYSLQEAYRLFLTSPLTYQEDFMFMGGRAFEYYFPVVDRYLREVAGDEDSDNVEAILGSGIALQFCWKNSALPESLVSEIEELSAFVQADLAHFSPEPEEQQRIQKEWKEVDEEIAKYRDQRKQRG